MGETQYDTLNIVETFYSIQGESSFIGKPCFFVRLHGCNLRCSYCDTKYAYDDKSTFDIIAIDELLDEAIDSPAQIIEFTGGEPLLQTEALLRLCFKLIHHKTILIETNGSMSLKPFSRAPSNLHIIMDIKTPSSGMHDKMDWSNLEDRFRGDQFKFVVGDWKDFSFAVDVCSEYGLGAAHEVLISPVFGSIPLDELAAWVLQYLPFARLQVQLHKIIWDPAKRGV